MSGNKFINFIKKILKVSKDCELDIYAGYATLLILMAAVPLIMLLIAVIFSIPYFSTEEFIDSLFNLLPDISYIQDMISEIINNVQSKSSTLLASVAALTTLFSASGGVSAIQAGLRKISPDSRTSLWDKPKALLFTILFIVQIIVLLVFQVFGNALESSLVSLSESFPVLSFAKSFASLMHVSWLISFAVIIITVLLFFTYLPAGKRKLKDQLPGAIFTSVLWLIFTYVFSFFMSRFWSASAIYGSLAAVFLMAMWLRYAITILFYGAVINLLNN